MHFSVWGLRSVELLSVVFRAMPRSGLVVRAQCVLVIPVKRHEQTFMTGDQFFLGHNGTMLRLSGPGAVEEQVVSTCTEQIREASAETTTRFVLRHSTLRSTDGRIQARLCMD